MSRDPEPKTQLEAFFFLLAIILCLIALPFYELWQKLFNRKKQH